MLARAVAVRANGPVLQRLASESQWAVSHEGQVSSTQSFVGGIAQLDEANVDEFVLWNFLVGSDVVRRGHRKGLDKAAKRWAGELQRDPNLRIRVLGYASVTGGSAINDDLAARRAVSVRSHLVSLGVPEEQVVVDSSGSRLPMDEGTTASGLARNRRVEVSKFVATRLRGSVKDLGVELQGGISFDTDTKLAGPLLSGNDVTFRLAKQIVRANVRVNSADPNVEVGFIRIVTHDERIAAYSTMDWEGDVARVRLPPDAALNYDHCMSAFIPCRDVQLAKLPFSMANGGNGQPPRTTGPTAAPVTLVHENEPQIVVPSHIVIPHWGMGAVTRIAWKLKYDVLVVVRRGDEIAIAGGLRWEMPLFIRMVAGVTPNKSSRYLDVLSSVAASTMPAAQTYPGIERAMSMPTHDLRERMLEELCRPELATRHGLGSLEHELDRVAQIRAET